MKVGAMQEDQVQFKWNSNGIEGQHREREEGKKEKYRQTFTQPWDMATWWGKV